MAYALARPRAGGPAGRRAGLPPTAAGVAALYRDICSRFVYDVADEAEAAQIKAAGMETAGPEPRAAGLLLHLGAAPDSLLAAVLRAD